MITKKRVIYGRGIQLKPPHRYSYCATWNGGYLALTTPGTRTTGQKIDKAIDQLPNNPKKAVHELENCTPREKFGDKVKNLGDEIKEKTDR